MPFKQSEVAEITVGGSRFRDWESVLVHMAEGESNNTFKFTVSEGSPLAKEAGARRIKPGDHCTVTLAGEMAISGYVETRQVAYTGTSHAVELIGQSYNKAAADGSVMHKTMEFKNKSFKQIADDVLKPFGIKFKPLTQISQKPFDRVNVAPGTTAFDLLETLARQRGVTLGTDTQGNTTGRAQWDQGGAKLIEGVNILEGREVLTISHGGGGEGGKSGPQVDFGQQSGSDKKFGPEVTHDPQGKSTKGSTEGLGKGVYAPQVSLSEHPSDKNDTQTRSDFESERREYEKFEVTIVVQGWLKPGGGALWKPGEKVHVKSPMLIVDEELKLMSADFSQDSRSGTRTTLTLTRDTGDADKGKAKYDFGSKG